MIKTFIFAALISLLTACAETPINSSVGANRGNNGCIGSAGYSWCAKTQQCERPWELAEKHAFDNTHSSFDKYCNASGN